MEILKKRITNTLLFLLLTTSLLAQTKVQEAFAKSYVLERNGEYKQAADKLKAVYDVSSYEINLRLGWLNYQAGIFTESIAHYQKAISLKSYSEEAKFGLIYPYVAIGKWDEVVNQYTKILSNSPNNTIANYRLGLIYYGRKEYEKAHKHFKVVVDLYPFDYDGLLLLAWTNYQQSKLREAKVLFNKVLLHTPNDASALEGLALIK